MSMGGLYLSLVGSNEVGRFSLARAWSAGEGGGEQGSEWGKKFSSEQGGGVSVASRRSCESTVSHKLLSVPVLSLVTPVTLYLRSTLSA